jgi:hypothetical protein
VPVPLWLRLPVAVLIVVWGARTDRRWTVAVAATIALPVLWLSGIAVLAGALPGLRARTARSRSATQPAFAPPSSGEATLRRDPQAPLQAGST